MDADARIPMEVEQDEEEVEGGVAMDTRMPMQEELAIAVASTPTPTPDQTYSSTVSLPTRTPSPTTVSLPTPTPTLTIVISSIPISMPIYATLTTTSAVPSNLVRICDAITGTLRYALGQGPPPTLLTQQVAPVQSTTSAQCPISCQMLSTSPLFNVHLDPADLDFLKKKAEECKARQKNVLVSEGQVDHYIKIVAVLEQSLPDGTGTALRKPLRTEQQGDREKLLLAGTGKVIVPKSLGLLSPTPSAGRPVIVAVPAWLPSRISLDVVVSSPGPTPRVQSPQALQTSSPGEPSIQKEAMEDDPFAHEMRTASVWSMATTTATSESNKQPSDVAIVLGD